MAAIERKSGERGPGTPGTRAFSERVGGGGEPASSPLVQKKLSLRGSFVEKDQNEKGLCACSGHSRITRPRSAST